jgi:uncharacterized protein YlxW (UPF0749 family)
MADWTDPTTWRDAGKHEAEITTLSKGLIEAKKRGDAAPDLETTAGLLDVLRGHQKSLADVSFVAGKLVGYTIESHEQRRREIDAIHDLAKSLKQLDRSVKQLARRVEKLEKQKTK